MGTISSSLKHSPLASWTRMLFGGSYASAPGQRTGLVETYMERAAQRRQLMFMEDSQLRDIGISRSEAIREAGKPFWKA